MSAAADATAAIASELIRLGLLDEEYAEQATLDELEEILVEGLHREIDELEEVDHTLPLATMVLWRAPDSPCDQRRMVLRSARDPLSLNGGGNRSGKTLGGFQLDVATALGADHPMVAAWLELNDLPPDLVPVGPGEVVISAISAGSSRRDHRRVVDALLPRWGKRWHGMNALAEAFVEIDCPGYDWPARIWFKSVDQGHEAYKGGKARRYHIDEEPSSDEGRLVVEECLRGAAGVGGTVAIYATPQEGETWLKRKLVDDRAYGCEHYVLDSLDNVLVDDYAALVRWFDSMDDEERRMRRFGEYVDRRGLVYTGWTRGDGSREGPGCTCAPFEIPADWPRFMGVDWGLKNPTAVLWGALGDDGTLYVYREHYEAGPTYAQHATAVHLAMGNELDDEGNLVTEREVIEGGWADPSGADQIDLWAGRDIYLDGATRDVKAGIDEVKDRMRVYADGRPRLKVFTTCTNLIREVGNYRWDPKRRDPTPIKKDDHALDALRYMCMGIREWEG